MNEVLKKRQMETMTEEWFLDNFCFPVKDYYLKLGFNFEKEPFDISGTEFINKYMERCHELQLHQGATDVLEYLKNLDVPQSLLSASSQVMLNQILINHDLNDYFTTGTLQYKVKQPFTLTETEGNYDVKVNVYGGGITGQAEAVRLALSRAMCEIDIENRGILKPEGLLTRDPRMVERKKFGQKKARKKFQFSKR